MVTVQELILKLLEVKDKTKKVRVEGCDCIRDAKSVDDNDPREVLIESRY